MHPPLLVVKFGGTSLATSTRLQRAAQRVRAHLRHDTQVVVIASALGHTTDHILDRISRLGIPPGTAGREIDRALATGETLSSALLAASLRALDVPARSLSGGEAGIEANGGVSAVRRGPRNRRGTPAGEGGLVIRLSPSWSATLVLSLALAACGDDCPAPEITIAQAAPSGDVQTGPVSTAAASLQAQGIPGTVCLADGRQLSGRVAFGSATFVQGQGITDANRPTDTLYFRADGATTLAMRAGEIRTIQIRYVPTGHGLFRREARLRTGTVRRIDGSIPVWHEAPAGPSRLVFTRYVEIGFPSGASRRLELADRVDVPAGDRVVAIHFAFAGPAAPERSLW